MTVLRIALALGGAAIGLAAAAPASAQFYLRSHDFRGEAVKGHEDGLGQPLPGATEAELRAAMAWSVRAALNVAALQCQFEPTLLTVPNYNAVLKDHEAELKSSFDTLTKYFLRVNKAPKAGQAALDQFGTRTYSGYATVAAQFGFCQTASGIGRDATFVPRGSFGSFAMDRVRELRNSLTPYGEQHFQRYLGRDYASQPRLDAICWNKKGEWVTKKCGVFAWPPASPTGTASVPAAATAATAPTVTAAAETAQR
ncbi:MAG: hypothetical protein EOP65_05070 [Sphingomonas sp.]|jgi:hypothetical protein|uniref:hypothetical protein n=1 Tax=Sphingomonas sp. CD22 TaxID=3100214 RepID=UPI00120594C8|nr:hypothetical protein [Sphingomonas sp. CD22]MEA1084183.1 hypothetical protein [Sphingomonas sp. CD22]RZL58812.1 MAG: hypothetical protein EOP65_05070 [Sphingomonas sp.]